MTREAERGMSVLLKNLVEEDGLAGLNGAADKNSSRVTESAKECDGDLV